MSKAGVFFWRMLLLLGSFAAIVSFFIQDRPRAQSPPPGVLNADCIVVKPDPACRVLEKRDFDEQMAKKAIPEAQRRLAYSKMSPVERTKLPPGRLYYSTATGDLVEAKIGPNVYVDSIDAVNPIVKSK